MARKSNREDYWIPLADLMTGLMLIFLLIAVSYAKSVHDQANAYVNVKSDIYKGLKKEFTTQELAQWGAQLIESPNITVRFTNPEILFDTNKSDIKDQFKLILNQFFPRYLKVVSNPQYQDVLSHVQIEGHTSSVWSNTNTDTAFFNNMNLSQARTISTLQYLYYLDRVEPLVISHDLNNWSSESYHQYLRQNVTANGLASSHLIYNDDGSENQQKSQRVEFTIILKSDQIAASLANKSES